MISLAFDTVTAIIGTSQFLLTATVTALCIKMYSLLILLRSGIRSKNAHLPWLFLITVLICAAFLDFSWILKHTRTNFLPSIPYQVQLFTLRLAWGCNAVMYHALSLFLESLSEKRYTIRKHQWFFMPFTAGFFIYFALLAILDRGCTSSFERTNVEFAMLQIQSYFVFIPITLSIFLILYRMKTHEMPRILKKQLSVIIQWLIVPFIASDFMQMYPFSFTPTTAPTSYTNVSLSTILLAYAIYYCTKKILTLRFLNLENHVTSSNAFNFITDFKTVLEQLSHVTNLRELRHITQTFFKDAFGISLNKTALYIRPNSTEVPEADLPDLSTTETITENFITTHENMCNVSSCIEQAQLLTYDEVAFSNFYEETSAHTTILQFLDTINADLFVPIFQQKKIIAYIVVDRFARDERFYSNIERDEILVFASYLGNIINLLHNRSLSTLAHKEKELREELYNKNQEISQYRESIRSFLRASPERKIGIIFYKNRRFTFGNTTAKELITINLNTQEGLPLSKAFRHVAQHVQDYKTSSSTTAITPEGAKIVIAGIPNLEQSNVIITIYFPEISDLLRQQIERLANPTEWDYLLYLETTESGKLINQLIPSSGPTLMSIKIELLKAALNQKALLLDATEEDLLPTVELLHHISLRETLHVMDLQELAPSPATAIKLFGINPLLGITDEPALLKKLDATGTLFIKNIHLLDIETQNYLAEFMKYGFFRVFKSDKRVASNVRIICSSSQNLQHLVHEELFSAALFAELKKTSLAMPPLSSLSDQEITELTEGFTEQALASHEFKNLLELTPKEKQKINLRRPLSLHALKQQVQHLLVEKSKNHHIYHETRFNPAYDISDPELMQAARLGKHALRDPKIMAMLWSKFKNQNKVAAFLGVNRSSINRRCKEYELI